MNEENHPAFPFIVRAAQRKSRRNLLFGEHAFFRYAVQLAKIL